MDTYAKAVNMLKKAITNANNKLKEVMNMFMANVIDHNQLVYMTNELKDVDIPGIDMIKSGQELYNKNKARINNYSLVKKIIKLFSKGE